MPIPTQKLPYVEHLELFVNVVAPFVSIYFLFLLRRPVFHLNLRILLAHFTLGLSGITISRSILLMYIFTSHDEKPTFWMQVIHDMFVFGLMTASVLMAGERIIATLFVDIYENVKGYRITLAACVVMQSMNFMMSYLGMMWRNDVTVLPDKTFEFKNPHHRLYIIAEMNALLAVNLIGFIMFFFIHRYNKRRWTIDLTKKLSHRYQISENVRTSRQLFMVLIGDLVITLYLYLVVLYIFTFQRNDFIADVIAQLLDLSMAIATVIMPMVFILTNPKLRVQFLRHFRLGEGSIAWTRKSVSNKPLVFSLATEGSVYFKQLAKSWGEYRPPS